MQNDSQEKKMTNRRKYKRFRVKDVTFAVLKDPSNQQEMGQIVDVSEGGLALCYLVSSKKTNNFKELDLILADNGFHIDEMLFIAVADFEVPNELPFDSLQKRKYSVEFIELTQDQKSKMKLFIKNHTTT